MLLYLCLYGANSMQMLSMILTFSPDEEIPVMNEHGKILLPLSTLASLL